MSHSLELNPRFLVDTAVDDLSGVTDPVAARTKLSVIRTVDTVAAVRLLSAAESVGVISLSGYYLAGDKPAVSYVWDAASVLTDDG